MSAIFLMDRDSNDRRAHTRSQPPYMTEEGLVLVDRRSQSERRAAPRQADALASIPIGEGRVIGAGNPLGGLFDL